MAIAAFDMFAAAKALQDAGVDAEQAQSIAAALADRDRDQLATKADLAVLRSDMANLRSELIVRLYAVAAALAAGLGGLLVAVLDRLP
ncbi:MAG: hypothetical protein F4Y03_16520 [Alphaproteobacteria bacterium]|nr:hypothetical protein [Alphaproteobacteria bacterium]